MSWFIKQIKSKKIKFNEFVLGETGNTFEIDYENDSILLKEQKMQEQEQEIMAEMQNQSQDAELDQMEQELTNMEQAGARIPTTPVEGSPAPIN